MQTPGLGRRLRSPFVAAGVIGALALSILPTAAVSAAGPATRVNIINLAPSAIQGQNFAFQVEAVDALGARDTSYDGSGTDLSFPGTSAGCVTTMIVTQFTGGLASVLDFACTTVGTAIIGADTADLAADLDTIQITSDRVLQFGSYPASSTPSLLGPQPTVQLRNGSGGLVTAVLDQVNVTLTVSPATILLTCSGGVTTQTIGGIASFSGCTLPAGPGYRLMASPTLLGSDVQPTTGVSFDVVGRKLAFTQQPGGTNAVPDQALPTEPIVAVQDSAGVTQTLQNSGSVTLTIATGPVGATLTCTGGNARNVANGLATFNGCAVSAQGTGYSLTATYAPTLVGEPSVQPATSALFNVNATPAQVSQSTSATIVNSGQGFTLTAQFATLGSGQSLSFQRKGAADLDWTTFATLDADASGRASTLYVPTDTAQYRVAFAGGGGLSAGSSNVLSVSARFSSGTMTPNYTGTKTLNKSTRVTYSVTSRPLNPAGVVPTVTFQIYRSIDGAWVFQTSATVASSSSGVATFSWTWSKSGSWYMRGRVNATAYNSGIYSNLAKVNID